MKTSPTLRVVIEPEPLSGAENMRRDAAMLDAVLDGEGPQLRWYRWDEPTLSLGRSQRDHPREAFAGVPTVARMSGGGAIVHDREWTYAIALGRADTPGGNPGAFYGLVHATITQAFTTYGLKLRPRGEAAPEKDSAFLCFLRGDSNDLLLPAGTKVVGSAQRRKRGAVLQHGSILWHAAAIGETTLPGVRDACEAVPPLDEAQPLLRDISDRIIRSLSRQS